MKEIICTYEDYDKMEAVFQEMYFKAGDYVPTEEQLEKQILPQLEKYIRFLLWIDITGHKTDENQAVRKRINNILKKHLKLVEEVK